MSYPYIWQTLYHVPTFARHLQSCLDDSMFCKASMKSTSDGVVNYASLLLQCSYMIIMHYYDRFPMGESVPNGKDMLIALPLLAIYYYIRRT